MVFVSITESEESFPSAVPEPQVPEQKEEIEEYRTVTTTERHVTRVGDEEPIVTERTTTSTYEDGIPVSYVKDRDIPAEELDETERDRLGLDRFETSADDSLLQSPVIEERTENSYGKPCPLKDGGMEEIYGD